MVLKEALLKQMIANVNTRGSFSIETLYKSAIEIDIKVALVSCIFPLGIIEVADCIIFAPCEIVKTKSYDDIKGFTAKVEQISQDWLDELVKNPILLQEIAKFYLKHPIASAKTLGSMADFVIKKASDKSLSMTYYTKRGVLAGIYASLIPDIIKGMDVDNLKKELHRKIYSTKNITKFKSRIKTILNNFRSRYPKPN